MNAAGRPYTIGYVASPHPHASFHVKTLDALPEVEAIHLCGLAGAEVDELSSASAKVSSTTNGLDELLTRPDLDALLVCVRNDLCPGVLNAAVGAELPTLFEKPGAVRAVDLREVAYSAAESGVSMGALYLRRWSPVMKEVRQIKRDGALGRVMAVEARMVTSQVRYRDPSHWLFRRETAGSGILSWLASHYIDTMCFLMDERIAEVTAMTGRQNPEPIEVEDTASVAFKFSGGALGTLNAGYHLAGSEPGYSGASYDSFLALRGTEGSIRLPLSEFNGYSLTSTAPGWGDADRNERRFEDPPSVAYGGVAGAEFVSAFLRAGREGGPAPCPIEDAVHVLEVVEAALESSATGRLVKVGTQG